MVREIPYENTVLRMGPQEWNYKLVRRPRLHDEQPWWYEMRIRLRLAWSVLIGENDVLTWNGYE